MTSVTFETATVADAVKKAARIAPGKGAAFDKAAGLLFEILATEVILKATNLEVYYTEWVDSIKIEPPEFGGEKWRLPSAMLAGILGGLPIGTGKTVTFTCDDGRVVNIVSGRTKARLNLISSEYYPEWYPFNPDQLTPVTALGARMQQVEWAASSGTEPPWNGVYLDGKGIAATDRYKIAHVPFDAPMLTRPVTIPAGILSPVIKQMGDTLVGIEGEQVLFMPDEHTQIRAVIYAVDYPDLTRVMDSERPNIVLFRKDDLVNMVTRMLNLVKADRFPLLKLFIGAEEIAGFMSADEVGDMEDAIELPGQALHEPIEIGFIPANLVSAVSAGPNDMITLGYDPSNLKKPVYLDGGSGFEAWVAPRANT